MAVGSTGHARVGHLNAGRVDAGVHVSHVHEHALAVCSSWDGGSGGRTAETEMGNCCRTKLLPTCCRAEKVQSSAS